MGIPIRFGWEFYGHLERSDGSVLSTRVFHIYYLPLIPLGTYELVGEGRGRKVAFSAKSLFAAFFKPWAFIAAIALAITSYSHGWSYHPEYLWHLVASGVLFLTTYASWLFLGHKLRPGNLRVIVVPVMAALTFALLGYVGWDQLPTRGEGRRQVDAAQYFKGSPPPSDMKFSMVKLAEATGEKSAKFEHVAPGTSLRKGDLVEIEVPGGWATGVIASADTGEWIDVQTRGGGDRRFTVSRQVLTVIR